MTGEATLVRMAVTEALAADREERHRIIAEVVRDAVLEATEAQRGILKDTIHEALTELGIDTDDPHEMQRDFQHLREWRQSAAELKSKGILALVGIVASGAAAALWLGVKDFLSRP